VLNSRLLGSSLNVEVKRSFTAESDSISWPNSRRTGWRSAGSLSASETTLASHSCWTLGSVGIQSPRLLDVRLLRTCCGQKYESERHTGEVLACQL